MMNLTEPTDNMHIRHSREEDIPRMQEVLSEARQIMRSNGNLHQWTGGYPSDEALRDDIRRGVSYLVEQDGVIIGTFAFIPGVEPTYLDIYEGSWKDDVSPYATIHRLGSTKDSHGVAQCCFQWAWGQVRNLRVDTHKDNTIMQHCIEKAGFEYCGIIYLENGNERLAYQKIIQL